jgi:F0F1-type ATP synthase gamma subunit
MSESEEHYYRTLLLNVTAEDNCRTLLQKIINDIITEHYYRTLLQNITAEHYYRTLLQNIITEHYY